MKWSLLAGIGAGLIAVNGCVVLEPSDGAITSHEDPIPFRGYASFPGQTIELEARNAGGQFVTFATTHAGTSALVLDDGTRLYAWDVSAVVPHWQGTGCDSSAEVRAMGVLGWKRTPLFTFDEAGSQCMGDALEGGISWRQAMSDCADAPGKTIALRAGASTLVADVHVTTQAEADALACVTTIDGNLTVIPAEPLISLPNLVTVTGSVAIEVQDTGPGGMSFVESEQVDLPLLANIGTNLTFHHVGGAYGVGVQLGLPALTTLAGDLDLLLSSFNGYNIGLSALQSVGGNAHILAKGDFYAASLLPALAHVAGDLSVATSSAGSSGAVLNALQTVGGSVLVDSLRSMNYAVLNGLTSVTGDLTLHRVYAPGPALTSLTSVGGTLAVTTSQASGLPAGLTLGGAGLSMGGLHLSASYFNALPFPAAPTIDAAGDITITDNAELCQSAVDAFVSAQQVAGWMGTLSVSNNTGTCMP